MVHTWQSDHLKKLELANVEAGDLVLCGAFADRAPMLQALDEQRVAFVAPLESRSDLEWLLRGLHLHPNIRHLVLCGDDLRIAGEALLALWQDGLDAEGAIAGGRGRLCEEIDADAVDTLRRDVKLLDWRGRSLPGLGEGIQGLPLLAPERKPQLLPDPEIPSRKVFLSRRTSFPLYANDLGDSWLQLLNLCLRIGGEKQTAEGERLAEALNVVVTVGLPVIAEDLEVDVAQPEDFPSFFDFGAEDFERYYERFDAPGSSDDVARNDYGGRLRAREGRDQIEIVCDRLKQSLDAQSATIVIHEPGDLVNSTFAPNAISATFNVVDQSLYGSFVLRSADVYSDWPLEAMALIRLQHDVAKRLELEPGAATFIVHAAHLYERDWQRAERVLAESFRRPLPLQVDHSGVFLFGNDGGQARGMLLDHDAGTIFWEDAFDSPIDLSWYIIDAMPWLLPQHMRYVGQECASLLRAMQERECYLQG
ncbi:MAG: hypothetical protein GY937_11260 [bacterium]|nr:hypothetical protein [bacterium]